MSELKNESEDRRVAEVSATTPALVVPDGFKVEYYIQVALPQPDAKVGQLGVLNECLIWQRWEATAITGDPRGGQYTADHVVAHEHFLALTASKRLRESQGLAPERVEPRYRLMKVVSQREVLEEG